MTAPELYSAVAVLVLFVVNPGKTKVCYCTPLPRWKTVEICLGNFSEQMFSKREILTIPIFLFFFVFDNFDNSISFIQNAKIPK